MQGFFLIAEREDSGDAPASDWLQSGDSLGEGFATTAPGRRTPLATGEALLLLVFDPQCGHCRDVIPLWREWTADPDPLLPVVTVTAGSRESARAFLTSYGWQPELWTIDPGAGVPGRRPIATRTPWLFLLDGEGVILADGHGRRIQTLAANLKEIMPWRKAHP